MVPVTNKAPAGYEYGLTLCWLCSNPAIYVEARLSKENRHARENWRCLDHIEDLSCGVEFIDPEISREIMRQHRRDQFKAIR